MTTHDFTALTDLASRTLGGTVSAANDELFAQRENLIRPEAAYYPDGGLSRLRLFGDLDEQALSDARRTWWDPLPPGHQALVADQAPR